MATIHDLTHPIRTGMPAYPGDPPVRITPWAEAAPWRVSAINLGSHTGTHIDAPRHSDPAGRTLDAFALADLIGPALILDGTGAGEDEALGLAVLSLRAQHLPPGSIVLIRTGWDRYWHDERYFRHPFLSQELARALAGSGAKVIGIDALSVGSSVSGGAAAHVALLGAEVLIVENLRGLETLRADRPYDVVFASLRLDQSNGAPVRVFAIETDTIKATTPH